MKKYEYGTVHSRGAELFVSQSKKSVRYNFYSMFQEKNCVLQGDKSNLVYATSDGFVYRVLSDVVKARCDLELQYFPFDTQVHAHSNRPVPYRATIRMRILRTYEWNSNT